MWSILYFQLIKAFIKRIYKITISKHVFFIILFVEFLSICFKDLTFFILFNLLLPICITDIINNDVHILFCILLALLGILTNSNISIYSFILPFLLLIIAMFTKGMGLGDIYLLFGLAFLFNLYDISLILLISSSFNLIYSLFKQKKSYAFVPFISIATIIVYLLT